MNYDGTKRSEEPSDRTIHYSIRRAGPDEHSEIASGNTERYLPGFVIEALNEAGLSVTRDVKVRYITSFEPAPIDAEIVEDDEQPSLLAEIRAAHPFTPSVEECHPFGDDSAVVKVAWGLTVVATPSDRTAGLYAVGAYRGAAWNEGGDPISGNLLELSRSQVLPAIELLTQMGRPDSKPKADGIVIERDEIHGEVKA